MTDTEAAKKPRSSRWPAGQSGNLKGKPPGTRNRVLMALDAIGDANAEAILKKAVAGALAGNLRSAELILSRCWQPRKGRPLHLPFPVLRTAEDLAGAIAAVVAAVAAGDLTPDEGSALAALLDTHRRAIETVELDRRITELERGPSHEPT